jgi:3-oxoacyl-[acyl-carrier-protein] synthase-3
MRSIKIVSTAKYLPKKVVTATEMDKRLGVNEGWVEKKTGVLKRHFVDDETCVSMGAIVVKEALTKANLKFEDLDLLVGANGTPAQAIPCTSALIQEALGAQKSGIPCFDINSTCLSFITALDTISFAIEAGQYKRVAIVSSEVASVGINLQQKESAALFGDGAACIIIEKDETGKCGILASSMNTYSSGAHDAEIKAGGTLKHPVAHNDVTNDDFMFNMNGPKIFRQASKLVRPFFDALLIKASIEKSEMKLFIPHQASMLSLAIAQKKMEISDDKFFRYVSDHGNQIAASLPTGLHNAIEEKKINRGDIVVMMGTSAGFSIGAVVLRY